MALRRLRTTCLLAGLALAFWVLPGDAWAQGSGPSARLVTLQGIRAATVAPSGLGFAALALSSRRSGPGGYIQDADGSSVVGFGLGDANKGVGLQVMANITSLKSSFGDSGHLSIKASRRMTAQTPTFVGLSMDRLAGWGDAKGVKPAVSVQLTWFPQTEIAGQTYPLMMTIGAGSHLAHNGRDPAVFFGAGIGLSANFGASLAWTGDTVTLGSAFRVDGLRNVTFAANLDDAFDQNDSRRVGLSATWLIDGLFGG